MMQRAKRQSDEFFTMLSCLAALSSAHLAKTPPVRGKLPGFVVDANLGYVRLLRLKQCQLMIMGIVGIS